MRWVTCRDCHYGWVVCDVCDNGDDEDRTPNCQWCGGYGGWECLSCEGQGEYAEEGGGYDDDND